MLSQLIWSGNKHWERRVQKPTRKPDAWATPGHLPNRRPGHPPREISVRNGTSPITHHDLPIRTTLWYCHIVEFIESPAFTRRLHKLAGDSADELLSAIQRELLEKPDRGTTVPGLGGVRKARIANPGRRKGKSGGYRYLYLYFERRQHIHLLILLDKNEQEDASDEQRKQMRGWVAQIKKDTGG